MGLSQAPRENRFRPRDFPQAARRAAEETKRALRQNAEVARARLAGEVEQARAQQMALQNQFGAVDQRAVKKLNAEKRVSGLTVVLCSVITFALCSSGEVGGLQIEFISFPLLCQKTRSNEDQEWTEVDKDNGLVG